MNAKQHHVKTVPPAATLTVGTSAIAWVPMVVPIVSYYHVNCIHVSMENVQIVWIFRMVLSVSVIADIKVSAQG
jgi:hypothetical protein